MSKKSGLLFERRLIEKIVKETGRCPVTDQPLEQDDLLPISSVDKTVHPRPVPATSIPGLLTLLQNEWDATMLESHQLRRSLHTARQELSHALYQHDAATRVIARLIRERDSYRELAEKSTTIQAELLPTKETTETNHGKRPVREGEEDAAVARMEDGEEGEKAGKGKKARPALGAEVVEAMTACSAELTKGRKKRSISPTLAKPEEIAAFSLIGSYPLHSTRKGGILALAVSPLSDSIIASAGVDGSIQVFDRVATRTLTSLKAHTKKVMDVSFIGKKSYQLLVSASADKTIKLWKSTADAHAEEDPSFECSAVMQEHTGEVISVNVHPTCDYLFSTSADGTWCIYDVNKAECLARVHNRDSQSSDKDTSDKLLPFTASALHPDGLIFCTGSADGIKVWETRTQNCVATFEGHAGSVASLSFSENGYHMASAAPDGVKLWDLRKLKTFHSLSPYGDGGGSTAAVAFDHSGLYLGVGGVDARVYAVKQDWSVIAQWSDVPAKKGVNVMAWGTDARCLMVGTGDHNLRVFGA